MWRYRGEFVECLRGVVGGGDARVCFDRFFQVCMGAVGFSFVDVEDAVDWARGVMDDFGVALDDFRERFHCSVVDGLVADSYWDAGLISGVNLRVGDVFLYASPLVPMATGCWMALVQEPVAASVLAVDGFVLMLPCGQYLEEKHSDALRELYPPEEDLSDHFSDAHHAYRRPGHIIIDTKHRMDTATLNQILEEYHVQAILQVNNSQQTAIIHTGTETQQPKLQNTIYYTWNQNTKNY